MPHLGTDQMFQFRFDAKTGKLTANTPPIVQMKSGWPAPPHRLQRQQVRLPAERANRRRHHPGARSEDGPAHAGERGIGAAAATASSSRAHRACRPAPGGPARDVSNDIWASDLHLTPDGKFLYAAERTSSTLGAFSVDAATGKLTYLSSTPVEKQPRGFRIHPNGKFMVVSGRAVGHDLGLRDRGERRPQAAAEVPDGQGLELGGDRQLRLRRDVPLADVTFVERKTKRET